MIKRFSIFALMAALLACGMIGTGLATIDTPTEVSSYIETPSAVRYSYVTPSCAASEADTARIQIQLPEIPYMQLSTAPTWRLLIGMRSSVAAADSAKVELWHGLSETEGVIYRSHPFDSSVVVSGVPQAFDITTVALSTDRFLQLDFTNMDDTAAVFNLDLTVIKGR